MAAIQNVVVVVMDVVVHIHERIINKQCGEQNDIQSANVTRRIHILL